MKLLALAARLSVVLLGACGDDASPSDGDDDGSGVGDASSASSFCDYVCNCHECDDEAREECESEFSAARDIAADEECSDVFDDARKCIVEDSTCGGNAKLEFDACDSLGDDLDECTDD